MIFIREIDRIVNFFENFHEFFKGIVIFDICRFSFSNFADFSKYFQVFFPFNFSVKPIETLIDFSIFTSFYFSFRHVRGDKTIVCKHWLRGLCKKGDSCEFLHEYDMTKMPECYFYSRFSKFYFIIRTLISKKLELINYFNFS